jgi:hypothetical protein
MFRAASIKDNPVSAKNFDKLLRFVRQFSGHRDIWVQAYHPVSTGKFLPGVLPCFWFFFKLLLASHNRGEKTI